jgi:diacylglycerol kinase family enzyme
MPTGMVDEPTSTTESDGSATRPSGVERIAAVVAFVALAAAVLVLVAGVRAAWRDLVIAIAGLIWAVAAIWQALGSRGARRVVAVVAALLGLAVFVTGVLGAGASGFRIVLAVVLAALAVAAARFALRQSVPRLRTAALAQTPAAPARRPALVINLRSGGGKAERTGLVEECRSRGIEPLVLGPGDDLVAIAERAVSGGVDVIGMAGGDGSQAAVAAVAMRHDVPLVVVPAGTRNHFALDLGLDRTDVVGALDAFTDGVERVIDVATVNGHLFVNNVSAGLYAQIVQSPEYRDAKQQTVLAMLPDLIGPDSEPPDLRYVDEDGESHPTAHVILVSNGPYSLHALTGRGTRERLDTGVLGIATLWIARSSEAGHYVAMEVTGRGARFPGLREWSAPTFRIDSDAPVPLGVDGETLVLEPPLLFESKPGALRVRVPRTAIGRSPSARAVHVLRRSTAARLAAVVAGRSDPSG